MSEYKGHIRCRVQKVFQSDGRVKVLEILRLLKVMEQKVGESGVSTVKGRA